LRALYENRNHVASHECNISLLKRKDTNITRLYGLPEEGEVEADMLKKMGETVWVLIKRSWIGEGKRTENGEVNRTVKILRE
jgi:hypothetical protein